MTYLKDETYYSDLYDRFTVERCRRLEEQWKEKDANPQDDKEETEEEKRMEKVVRELFIFAETGERYLDKKQRIREWMERDQRYDDLYENAQAPADIRCLMCRSRVIPGHKQLWTETDKPDRMLFIYDCPNNCLPHRMFFSDGEEWRRKPKPCPKCLADLEEKIEDDTKKMITTSTCTKCDYTNVDEYEWSYNKEEEIDLNFPKDRDRFCLTKEDGDKYWDEKNRMLQLIEIGKEWDKEEKARAEKLKLNPEGYHLEGRRTCAICRDVTAEGDNWYDQYGTKCLVCQKAIDNKEIPATVASDEDSWYSKYDLERYFNLKGSTLRKWIKDGIIKPRKISHFGNGVHYELFLIEDNEEFLPPKNILESKSVKEIKDGKEYRVMHPWYHFVNPEEHLKGYKIMDHMRIVPPGEMAEREKAKK